MDRNLFLNSATLDPVNRAAVEIVAETRPGLMSREILKFRRLFKVANFDAPTEQMGSIGAARIFVVDDYFEDENGIEILFSEIAAIKTGNSNSIVIPAGAKQHDIDLMLADSAPMPIGDVQLNVDDFECLAIFCRDHQELLGAAFLKESPATYSTGGIGPALSTSATEDEIRSYVMVFRRIYMEKEPANFPKAVAAFARALGDHPLANWATAEANDWKQQLSKIPERRPFLDGVTITFSTKRLIDVYLYTRFAHQPDERRTRQFNECLREINGNLDFLTWMFLSEIWKLGLSARNVGRIIHSLFLKYCQHNNVSPDGMKPFLAEHSGLGTTETEKEKRDRVYREKVELIAMDMWQQNGRPEGGPTQFLIHAREKLSEALGNETRI